MVSESEDNEFSTIGESNILQSDKFRIDYDLLNILAMIFMIVDHSGMILFGNNLVMRGIGRLAFPIFCFQIVEGTRHTSNVVSYAKRLFLMGLISEIPFNLMKAKIIDPTRNNVMFELLLCVGVTVIIDKIAQEGVKRSSRVAGILGICGIVGLSELLQLDYGSRGILLAVSFAVAKWIAPKSKIKELIIPLIASIVLFGVLDNSLIIGNTGIHIQTLCCLSFVFIWLYDSNKPGMLKQSSKHSLQKIRKLKYWVYPIHMLIIVTIKFILV